MGKKIRNRVIPDGVYDEVAIETGLSYGTIAGYYGAAETRISVETELLILEWTKKISLKRIRSYLREKEVEAKKRKELKEKKKQAKQAIAA